MTGIWVYLAASPLLWLTLTLLAWLAATGLHERAGRPALLHPVAVSVGLLIALLWATGTPYQRFFDGAQFVHFLLGPATVALAVPLWRHRAEVRRRLLPLTAALLAGSATAVASAMLVGRWLGAAPETVASLAPKSATSPIAMGVAEQLGGLPSLTGALVLATGLLGAMVGLPLLRAAGVRDPAAQGVAIGLTSHGIGTAAAFQAHPLAGTFAGILMALNGLATALLAPLIVRWLG
ncbi:MAG TPA: LrgB family protein [Azospirillaceae bacterium]|nr:LrgB family protein [Azospirillaceae bacterium]